MHVRSCVRVDAQQPHTQAHNATQRAPSIFCTMYSWSMSLSPGNRGCPVLSSAMMQLQDRRAHAQTHTHTHTGLRVAAREVVVCQLALAPMLHSSWKQRSALTHPTAHTSTSLP
jgi:hypothetical protein